MIKPIPDAGCFLILDFRFWIGGNADALSFHIFLCVFGLPRHSFAQAGRRRATLREEKILKMSMRKRYLNLKHKT